MKLELKFIDDNDNVVETRIVENISNTTKIIIEPEASIKTIVHEFKVIPTECLLTDADQRFIDNLCLRFNDVCRGGKNAKFWSNHNATINDIIILEEGIRGPADYFYKKDGVWHHGNYTAYKDTYTDEQLTDMCIRIEKHNLKYRSHE